MYFCLTSVSWRLAPKMILRAVDIVHWMNNLRGAMNLRNYSVIL